MKIISKHQAIPKKVGSSCTVTEYPLNHEKIDIAVATITGRYPETGRVVNQECSELGYVQEGIGKIVVNGDEFSLAAGDTIIIDAGEPYYWEGNMQLLLSCQPIWNPDQHKHLDV